MTRGTKIALAASLVVVVLLALYYGLLLPDDGPPVAAVDGPPTAPGEMSEPVPSDSDSALRASPTATTVPPRSEDPAGLLSGIGGADWMDPTSGLYRNPAGGQDPLAMDQPTGPVSPVSPAPGNMGAASATPARRPAPVSDPPPYTDYRVKRYDTMSSIAEEWFGDATMWTLVAQANPLVDPTRLQINQTLRLPPRDARHVPADTTARSTGGARRHTVSAGETLSEIAMTYYGNGGRWKRIYDANRGMIGVDPNALEVGMRLVIPSAES